MDIKTTWNLTELRDFAKQFPEVVKSETIRAMNLIVARLEKEVVERTPRGVGGGAGLAGSILGETVSMGTSITGIVGTPMSYGEVIELGRRPGKKQPPVSALIPWVRSILGITSVKEQKSVAFLIARSIGIHGFKGVQMFGRAWASNQAWVQQQIYNILDRVTKKVNETGKK